MKKKTILTLTMAFVMAALAVTPLFAHNLTEVKIDTASLADTTNLIKKVVKEEQKKKPQNDKIPEGYYTLWWIAHLAISIENNDPAYFDQMYNKMLKNFDTPNIKAFLTITFESFNYVDDDKGQNAFSIAIRYGHVESFMGLYKNLDDSEKEELLKDAFSKFEIKPDMKKLYLDIVNKIHKK